MENVPVIDIVASSPLSQDTEKLEAWYSNVHISMIMKYGAESVERFKALNENSDYPVYLNMYHYPNIRGYDQRFSPEASAEISKDLQATWPNGHGVRWHVWYVEYKKWGVATAIPILKNTIMYIIGTNSPSPEKDAEFNTWYDNTHIPWLMKTGMLVGAVRYRIMFENKDYPSYLAIYYYDNRARYDEFFDHPERLAALKELHEHWPNWNDIMTWSLEYEFQKSWRK
jgi:hypothetical protein